MERFYFWCSEDAAVSTIFSFPLKKKKKKACHLFQHPLCILKSSLSGDGGSCEVRHPPSPFSILFMHLYTRKAIKIMDKQAEQCYITFKWRKGVWYTIGNILLLKTSYTEGALSAAFPQLFFIEITRFFFFNHLLETKQIIHEMTVTMDYIQQWKRWGWLQSASIVWCFNTLGSYRRHLNVRALRATT